MKRKVFVELRGHSSRGVEDLRLAIIQAFQFEGYDEVDLSIEADNDPNLLDSEVITTGVDPDSEADENIRVFFQRTFGTKNVTFIS